jgi:Uncharacterized protein conserved in bacteria
MAGQASLIANMEMWRWMPRDLGQDRIEVNIPDYMVTVFHDGEPSRRTASWLARPIRRRRCFRTR